jgi:predicted nucleotidyltransferase
MKYGLSEKQLNEIVTFISPYSEIEEAVLFGSRAIDTYKEASDVDIALKGDRVTASLAAKLKFEIEEDTYLPFFFDFVAYPIITNEALKEHIDTKGITLYRKGWRVCKLGEVCTKVFLTANQACCNLIINENIADPDFIFYYLWNSCDELVNRKTGSAPPHLNTELIKLLEIQLPPLSEQRAIVAVLSGLDDKIDLLHRQNKTLEAMAETLFSREVKLIDDKVISNCKQIQLLERLRDTLLPKLVSGEARAEKYGPEKAAKPFAIYPDFTGDDFRAAFK